LARLLLNHLDRTALLAAICSPPRLSRSYWEKKPAVDHFSKS
jgi:hypothetical protein